MSLTSFTIFRHGCFPHRNPVSFFFTWRNSVKWEFLYLVFQEFSSHDTLLEIVKQFFFQCAPPQKKKKNIRGGIENFCIRASPYAHRQFTFAISSHALATAISTGKTVLCLFPRCRTEAKLQIILFPSGRGSLRNVFSFDGVSTTRFINTVAYTAVAKQQILNNATVGLQQ
jgi:hypothetical protein